jgi:hypothetical protein
MSKGELSKRIWSLAYPDGTIEGNDSIEIDNILDEAKAEFPTPSYEELKLVAKQRFPKRNFDKYTAKNRSIIQSILLLKIEKWYLKWFNGETK